MKKVSIPELPWVVMKDGSFSDYHIWLVYQWTKTNGDEKTDMGIIIMRHKDVKDVKDAVPTTLKVELKKLSFVQYRSIQI